MSLLTTTLWTILSLLAADDPGPADATIDRWNDLYAARAQAIVATEESEPPRPLTLSPKPLLRYTNPVRPDIQHGTVHLWVDRGLPRSIGTIWSAEDKDDRSRRNLCYEFHSLSEFPLTVTMDQTAEKWRPRKPGLEWIVLKDAPKPHQSRALRLTQMRRLVADWQVVGLEAEDKLRLLTQPLYRYPEDVEGPVDGAIFAFVMGTDPELFIVLEAWKGTPEQADVWQISPARLTGTPLTLKSANGDILWSSPTWENFDREKVYDFLYGIERLTDEDLESVE